MDELWLQINLKSDSCFSKGEGTPGVVDVEVNHDEDGFPFLGGRTLKGILHEESATMLYGIKQTSEARFKYWEAVHISLFGQSGGLENSGGKLHFSDAKLPAPLRWEVNRLNQKDARDKDYLSPLTVLSLLTTVRKQTAMENGVYKDGSLRAIRVIVRGISFVASISTFSALSKDEKAYLYACVQLLRRIGNQKNRGLGRVQTNLFEDQELTKPLTATDRASFTTQLGGGS